MFGVLGLYRPFVSSHRVQVSSFFHIMCDSSSVWGEGISWQHYYLVGWELVSLEAPLTTTFLLSTISSIMLELFVNCSQLFVQNYLLQQSYTPNVEQPA